jgi:hypothetical protein
VGIEAAVAPYEDRIVAEGVMPFFRLGPEGLVVGSLGASVEFMRELDEGVTRKFEFQSKLRELLPGYFF